MGGDRCEGSSISPVNRETVTLKTLPRRVLSPPCVSRDFHLYYFGPEGLPAEADAHSRSVRRSQ